MQRLRPTGDDGAVAVLVGVLVALGVLFGMGALAIDVGAMYAERGQLQNGADAAALAVAIDCASGASCDPTFSGDLAQQYANANANDLEADAQVTLGVGNVIVGTSTLNNGSAALPPVFGRLLPAYEDKTIHASATARWGGPISMRAMPLGVGRCELPASYPTMPVSGPGTTIMFPDPDTEADPECGFGWLEGEPCNMDSLPEFAVGDSVNVSQESVPTDIECTPGNLDQIIATGEPIPIPILAAGGGFSFNRRVAGFGAFVLTSYQLAGSTPPWYSSPRPDGCPPDGNCIQGHFVFFITDTGEFGGPSMGLTIIRLIE